METLRIDRLLWFLRFAKSRSLAQAIVGQGHLRLNGTRVFRCAQGVAPGDRLVLPIGAKVIMIEIAVIPQRRGPASEATACYRVLDETPAFPIAAPRHETGPKEDLQP